MPYKDAQKLLESTRDKVAKHRLKAHDIWPIPEVKNSKRKARCKKNPETYLRTYFPKKFSTPFCDNQREVIRLLVHHMRHGGWQAMALERGGGKTSIVEGMITYAVNYGYLRFPVILGANADQGKAILESIKGLYEDSDLLLEDFPEICHAVRAIADSPQRARYQHCKGILTKIKWGVSEIRMPTVGKSAASGALIVAAGIDKAMRGLKRRTERPDFVLLDDIETRESVASLVETRRRIKTIEEDVTGLAGPDKLMSIVMACTIMRKGCIADQYTDRKQKPAWHGVRKKMLIQKPDNLELWGKYMELRQADQMDVENTPTTAVDFYIENREAMDAGAVVSNINRYDHDLEVSAIQSIHNKICDMGQESFDVEYQNEPPEDVSETSGIDAPAIQNKLSQVPRGVVPAGVDILAVGIDIGGRLIHWVVTGFSRVGGIGRIIDYGVEPVHSPTGDLTNRENQQAVEAAILNALLLWRDTQRETGYAVEGGGENKHIDIALIDAGWQPQPVYRFCKASSGNVYRPSKGFGSGTRQTIYREPAKPMRRGMHWHASLQRGPRLLLFNIDADHYKQRTHDGFMSPHNANGSLMLYGDNGLVHRDFARQILSEVFVNEWVAGKGWRGYWDRRYSKNHWLDAMGSSIAGAEILGVTVLNTTPESNDRNTQHQHRQEPKQVRRNTPMRSNVPTIRTKY